MDETSAIGTLRTLSTCQANWQSAMMVDQDQDRSPEYGWFHELAGVAPYRTADGLSAQPTSPAFITRVLGTTAMTNNGIATKSGYHFLMYLPSATGTAIPEPAEPAPTMM